MGIWRMVRLSLGMDRVMSLSLCGGPEVPSWFLEW